MTKLSHSNTIWVLPYGHPVRQDTMDRTSSWDMILYIWVELWNYFKLEGGPMPNVMVALPNTGGALCSTPQSLADAHY